jgi:hypothetical protein
MTLETMAALSDDRRRIASHGAFLRGEAAKGVGDGLPEVEDGSPGSGAQ